MRLTILFLSVFFCRLCYADFTITSASFLACPAVVAASNSCSHVRAAYDNCLHLTAPSANTTTCSSDPVISGTTINSNVGSWTVSGVTLIVPTCQAGSHVDTSTNTCVPDIPTTVCIPASRTVAPCPSGYAPNEVSIESGPVNGYSSSFDTMSVQDLIYAVGVCLFGVLGLGVGVKLT